MKVERIFYGMQTSNGKISLVKTSGVNNLLSYRNIEYIKGLKPVDSHKYLWFRTEQTIAYSVIIEVEDKDPKHGGRTWVQNQTFLVNIHDFLTHFIDHNNPFADLVLSEVDVLPDTFNAITI